MYFIGVEACSPKKIGFNGGFNCSGSGDIISCSLSCPQGVKFEFQPANKYSCDYSVGEFLPRNIPQCAFSKDLTICLK